MLLGVYTTFAYTCAANIDSKQKLFQYKNEVREGSQMGPPREWNKFLNLTNRKGGLIFDLLSPTVALSTGTVIAMSARPRN
jgi:hypothetical protein